MNVARDPGLQTISCSGNPAWESLLRCKRLLLLQGPVGPFFDRLGASLRQRGALVTRIAFHGGDLWDSRLLPALPFCGHPSEWRSFLRDLLATRDIRGVALFGQSRHYHEVALDVCEQHGVETYVFEEGYFRPGFTTLEHQGINGRSSSLKIYKWSGSRPPAPAPARGVFGRAASFAMLHYLAIAHYRSRFPHYEHHRPTNPLFYARWWVRGWMRRWAWSRSNRALCERLFSQGTPYFFVPLQFHEDSQIRLFSPFSCNRDFLSVLLDSFAEYAPNGAQLVIKQHPHARGGEAPRAHIQQLAQELGLTGRVHFLIEGPVGALVANAKGVVTVNSTTGLLALDAGVPLFTMGDSVYRDAPGVDQGALDTFWSEPRRHLHPSGAKSFITALKGLTQVPLDLYASRLAPLEL